ncbi:MAG: CAP domain-containing protein [Candidatus Paceibacterota bacterium]|jgi:hypothetical protein
MFNWFKKHFIPHEGNEHRPHALRADSIRNIVAIVIFLEIFTFLIPIISRVNIEGGMAAVLPGVLSMLTNEERQSQNLQVLTASPILNQAAEMKANDMATKGYFAHTSPEGKTPWYWLEKVGYKYQYAGENLAVNFSDSKDVTNAWMQSPTHKANIVKGNYTEIGTGVARGMYEGRETIFVAQVYANPLSLGVADLPVVKSVPENKVEEIPKVIAEERATSVLGAETAPMAEGAPEIAAKPIQNPTLWQKLLASPRNTMNIILFIVFGIIVLTLLVYIIIKARQYHLDLITNGLIALAIIGAIFVVNYYFTHRNMVITQSLDYSYENN